MKEEKAVDERVGRTRNIEPSFVWRDFERAKTAVIPPNEKEGELKSRSIVNPYGTIDSRALCHESAMQRSTKSCCAATPLSIQMRYIVMQS